MKNLLLSLPVCLLILLPLAGAAQAQSVLVSNIRQTYINNGINLDDLTVAQAFTTGSNSAGYSLSSIELKLEKFTSAIANLTVYLCSGSGDGTVVATLSGSVSGTGVINEIFTPRSATSLAPNTTYWVMAQSDTIVYWEKPLSDSEDSDSESDWQIADNGNYLYLGVWRTDPAYFIRVNGTTKTAPSVNPPPPPPPPPVTSPVTPPVTPPTPPGITPDYYSPANLVANLSNDGAAVRVDWNRPVSDHIERTDHFLTWLRSGYITSNNFILGPDTLITQVDKSENDITITGLPVGVPYTFFVRSVYEDGGQGSASRISLPAFTSAVSTDTTPVSTQAEEIPESVRLEQNYPNPFNPQTTIDYALPKAGDVRLVVYDMLGHEVGVLIDGPQAAGLHAVRFGADHLPNGTYVYRLVAGDKVLVRTMVLVK